MGDGQPELCSVCEEYFAEFFCRKCDRKICQECDEVIHMIPDKTTHERFPLKPPEADAPCEMEEVCRRPTRYKCDIGCGFTGSYREVQLHELNCPAVWSQRPALPTAVNAERRRATLSADRKCCDHDACCALNPCAPRRGPTSACEECWCGIWLCFLFAVLLIGLIVGLAGCAQKGADCGGGRGSGSKHRG